MCKDATNRGLPFRKPGYIQYLSADKSHLKNSLPSGFDRVHNRLERAGMPYGDLGEHFTIEPDLGFPEKIHEYGIRQPVHAAGRVYTRDPEPAEIPLAHPPVAERVRPRLDHGFFGCLEPASTRAGVALYCLEDLLVTSASGYACFYSYHCI